MGLNKRNLVWFVVAFAIVVILQFLVQQREDKDVVFCRNLYARLANGSPVVERSIDWDNFKMLGRDVGVMYESTSPQQRFEFKNNFIKGFNAAFIAFKGKLGFFRNWRIYHRGEDKVVVACDYLKYNKVLLFTLSKTGQERKLSSIDWGK